MSEKSLLHFTEAGNGKTALVFLHFFGGSGRTWSDVIELMKDKYRCIAIDLLGFGKSPAPARELSVSDQADEVVKVMAELNIEKFILVGHSMGGKIAMLIASRKPDGLVSVILLAPSPPTPEPMTDKKSADLKNAFGNSDELFKIVEGIISRPVDNLRLQLLLEDHLLVDRIAWNSWIDKGAREDISGEMKNFKVPLLVISGDKEKILTPVFLREEFEKFFPEILFRVIGGAGHVLPVECPGEVCQIVEEFVGEG